MKYILNLIILNICFFNLLYSSQFISANNPSFKRINNPVSTTQVISSTDTINSNYTYSVVASTGGAVEMTSTLQISTTTTKIGDTLEIWGSSDTDTITLVDGNGLKLDNNTSMTLGLDDNICFRFVSSEYWAEVSRSNN